MPAVGTDPHAAIKRCPRCAEAIPSSATKCRYCGSEFVPSTEVDAINRVLRANSTLLISLATFLFVVFQVARVSGYEVNNVVALLKGTGLATIVIGVLVAQLHLFVLLLLLVTSWWLVAAADGRSAAGGPPAGRGRETSGGMRLDGRVVPTAVLVALLLVGFFGLIWPIFLVGAVFAIRALLRAFRAPSGRRPRRFQWGVIVVGLIAVALLFGRESIWLAIEDIQTSDRGRLVAYVVGEEGGWTTLLTPGHRIILEPSDHITSREICALGSIDTRVFADWLRLRPIQLVSAARDGHLPKAQTPGCPTETG